VLAGKPCQMQRSSLFMRSSHDYQNCTWRSILTTGTGHGPSGHASWMERRWGSQNISHWCDSVGKKWDNSGVEKVVQTWVSFHLTWRLLGPQVQDTLLPHPPMELVPAPQNIQQEEVAHFTTPLIASLPQMCLISPLTPLYQLHLMEVPVAGITMMNEFQQDMEKLWLCQLPPSPHCREEGVRNFSGSWVRTPLSGLSKMQRHKN